MNQSALRLIAHSRRLFPTCDATITVTRRSWWSGLIISHVFATEWLDAYRAR